MAPGLVGPSVGGALVGPLVGGALVGPLVGGAFVGPLVGGLVGAGVVVVDVVVVVGSVVELRSSMSWLSQPKWKLPGHLSRSSVQLNW